MSLAVEEAPLVLIIPTYEIITESVVIYKISLKQGEVSWSASHRYSNFNNLYNLIHQQFPQLKLPPFPSKKPWRTSKTGATDPEFLERRRKQLETYMQALLTYRAVLQFDPFRSFIMLNNRSLKTQSIISEVAVPLGCFGLILEDVMKTKSNIGHPMPMIVMLCLTHIVETGLDKEGIFRISANYADLMDAKRRFNEGEIVELSRYVDSHHLAAALLKLFLRELPEPLLSFSRYDDFLSLNDLPEGDKILRIELAKQIITGLPPINFRITEAVFDCLGKIVDNALVNYMNINNLVMIFAPVMLRTREDDISSMVMDSGKQFEVIRFLLEERQAIFEKPNEIQ